MVIWRCNGDRMRWSQLLAIGWVHMKKRNLRAAGLAFLLLVSVRSAWADNIFILRASAATASAIAERHGLTLVSAPDAHDLAVLSQSDARPPDQVVTEVQQDPDVQGIEFQSKVIVPEVASGPQLGQSTAAILDVLAGTAPVSYFGSSVWSSYVRQAAAILINLDEAHEDLATGAGIVAVLDTGVDPSHPLLQNSLVPGYDFVNGISGTASEWSDLDPAIAALLGQPISTTGTVVLVNQSTAAILDQSTAAILDTSHLPGAFGHGTMVAGIIHLVAPTAKIMPLKVFGSDGTANLSDIVRAIYFAVDNGARVINMSFSFSSPSISLMKAINYATAHDVVCVASVGNDGAETLRYPASYRNVIGVASTDNSDTRSAFSNYGEALVDIAAPGEGIVTAYPGGHYAVVSGTSFAAPMVSGGAALLVQRDTDLDQKEASQGFSNAKKLDTSAVGGGRLDLYKALKAIR